MSPETAETDDAYLAGADAGRLAAAAVAIAAIDVLQIDLYAWQAEAAAVTPATSQSFIDGWMKSYHDTRAKLRAATRSLASDSR